jgi:hypothetical protein
MCTITSFELSWTRGLAGRYGGGRVRRSLQDALSSLPLNTLGTASLGSSPDSPGESAGRRRRVQRVFLALFGQLVLSYSLVGLSSVLKGGEDVGVRATLDAVNEVRNFAEEGCYRNQV